MPVFVFVAAAAAAAATSTKLEPTDYRDTRRREGAGLSVRCKGTISRKHRLLVDESLFV